MFNGIKSIKGLLKNSTFYHAKNFVLGSFASRGLVFLSIILFSHLLTPEDYGRIEIFTSVLQIAAVLSVLGFVGVIPNKFLKEGNQFDEFIGTNIIFIQAYQIFFIFISLYFKLSITNYFNIDVKLYIFGVISGVFMGVFNLYNAYLKASLQSKKFGFLNFIFSLLNATIAIVLILFFDSEKYLGKIYAALLVVILFGFYAYYHLYKIATFKFKKEHLVYALAFSIPFMPHLLSQFILGSFDRIIINQLVGEAQTGLYSFAYNIALIFNVITIAIMSSWTPKFYGLYKDRSYIEINEGVKTINKIILVIAFGLICFSTEMVIALSGKNYYEAAFIVPWVILGYVFLYLYMNYSLYASYHKKTFSFSLITIIVGTINVCLNYYLIPKFGYYIASITTLFCYVLMFLFHWGNAKYILKKKIIPLSVFLYSLIIFLFFFCFQYFVKSNIENYWLELGVKIILLVTLATIFFKKQKQKQNKNGLSKFDKRE